MKTKSRGYSESKKQNIPSINAISIPTSRFVVQKSGWEFLPSVLWVEIIFPFMDNIKIFLDLAKVSHQFHILANDKKTVFNLFIKTFYYLREFFSKTADDLKNPLKEMGNQLINALETYDKKILWYKVNSPLSNTNNIWHILDYSGTSSLEISPDFHRKFTILLEIGDIEAAITTLIKTSLDRETLAEDLSSFRSHGGQTVLGELKKPFKFISISDITENFQQKIHLQNNHYLDKIFYNYIIHYFRKLINNNPVNINFFQMDWRNRAEAVLETILKTKGKDLAPLYVLSYACSQFYFFSKIHAEFKKMTEKEYGPAKKYSSSKAGILPYCIIYKQAELMQALFEQIPTLWWVYTAKLVKLSTYYSDPLAMHLVLEKCNDPKLRIFLNQIPDETNNPVFLYNLIKLRSQNFLNSAFEMELNKKIIIIDLLSAMGCNPVAWFLTSWRNHLLTKGQERQPSTQKEFGDLIFHFGRQNIPNFSANLDNLTLLILKLSPIPHKHAQQILESKQLFRPQVLYEASNLINQKIVTDSLVSEGLLAGHKRKRNSDSNPETQQSLASFPGIG